MQPRQPSLTARSAAAHRAAHQELEGGRVFRDPLAVRILGGDAADIAREATAHPERRTMRLFIAARTRVAEDALSVAVGRGVRQLVVLGAGLDTFAYRNPYEGLAVFEVDHPSTQAWKRERLADAGVVPPSSLTFAPVDFEREELAEGLAAAGLDPARPAFFSWLGVVPYLTRAAVFDTLGFIASLPSGAEVVFDYGDPPSHRSVEQRAAHDARAARVAELGEPWISYFTAEALATDLAGLGFSTIEDLGPTQLAARYFGGPADAPPRPGGHVIRAGTLATS